MGTQIKLHGPRCYRIYLGKKNFGQIRKEGLKWHAEIRHSETGALVRYAGIWKTRKDAIEEIEWILTREDTTFEEKIEKLKND